MTLAERKKDGMYLDENNTWRMDCGCTEANVLDDNHNVCEKTTDILWCVSVETKHGVDTVLIRQEKEPTVEEMDEIKNVFMHNFDMEEDQIYVSTECGMRYISDLPTSVDDYVRREKA